MFPQLCPQQPAPPARLAAAGEANEPAEPGTGDSLEDAARDLRDYARERLRRELDRDPAEEEIDDWLRKHTEGY